MSGGLQAGGRYAGGGMRAGAVDHSPSQFLSVSPCVVSNPVHLPTERSYFYLHRYDSC